MYIKLVLDIRGKIISYDKTKERENAFQTFPVRCAQTVGYIVNRAVFTWLSKVIGFGFGFTTPFGWLVYLLWFWFYDSQVKTALYVVVNILTQVVFDFRLFLAMVMYTNEVERKEK